MDSFIKRSAPSSSTQQDEPAKKATPKNFLREANRKFEESNADVGLDILGDLKGNLENVMGYFDLVKELGNIKGEIQQLVFSQPFPEKEYRLLEVDQEMLEAFERGERFAFRGDPDEHVVLCTETKTYEVKETETSNSLVITPYLSVEGGVADGRNTLTTRQVTGIKRHYLELKEMTVVSVSKLRKILREDEIIDTPENSRGDKRLTRKDLLERVQMSEGEMDKAMEGMPLVHFEDGSIRWLSIDYRNLLLDRVVDIMNDQSLESATVSLSFDLLRIKIDDPVRFPDCVFHWFLRSHCRLDEGGLFYHPCPREMCRTRALSVLTTSKKFPLPAFKEKLENMLPIGMELKWEYLDGLALRSESLTAGEEIEYMMAEELPDTPRERLSVLFSIRSSWTPKEAAPFLSDIIPRGTTVASFLLQHCRAETVGDARVFCSLRPL